MQITLNQDEIEIAVQDYVRTQINVAEGQDITIDFVNGRSPNGLSATLNIQAAATGRAPKREPNPDIEAETARMKPATLDPKPLKSVSGADVTAAVKGKPEAEPETQTEEPTGEAEASTEEVPAAEAPTEEPAAEEEAPKPKSIFSKAS